uniref:Hypothetical conserved protein n=1 Tax=uncultured prokaryote TaxID=198431 RepID=H5SEF5_9ZZZZ|nr:hypothetical conserved protein [uncultured prokaryote]
MITILDLMRDERLCGAQFRGATWTAWEACLAAAFGLPMPSPEHRDAFHRHTRRDVYTAGRPCRELFAVVGRGGGKSRIAALIATYLATMRDYRRHLAPGEVATVAVIAADRRQARAAMRYIRGAIEYSPALSELIAAPPKSESIALRNNVLIEVHTASYRSTRGYTLAAAILDELAFWRTDDGSANPDAEIVAALRPGLAKMPGSMLIGISSPYARRGVLWDAYQRHFGRADSTTLVWQGSTCEMNPLFDREIVDAELARDPIRARAEYLAEFREDVTNYVPEDVIRRAVDAGRALSRPSESEIYRAFVDPSGGARDSFALAIAHTPRAESSRPAHARTLVIDAIHEWRAPCSPQRVVSEIAAILAQYRIRKVWGDAYAGEWVAGEFTQHGIRYERCELNRSALYLHLEPLLMTQRIRLPEHERLMSQLMGLERKTGRTGSDSVDHAPGAHDDLANAVAGAAYVALRYDPYYVPVA